MGDENWLAVDIIEVVANELSLAVVPFICARKWKGFWVSK
jgi:hypothetical protein